jgi:hypothetical protein
MLVFKILFYLKGIRRRIQFHGAFDTCKELFHYVQFYNQILVLNGYDLSFRRKLSHFTFYSKVCFLFPYISRDEILKIVPRSLTHSPYEKLNINRKELTFDKLTMYQNLTQFQISIPKTFYHKNKSPFQLGSVEEISYNSLDDILISKPRFSNGGKGIKIIRKKNISVESDILYQEVLQNHSEITNIQKNDFCSTLRYVFDNTDEFSPIGASFQFNTGKEIDHMMQGGSISVRVDTVSGKLLGKGFNSKGKSFDIHPISEIVFAHFQLPNWNFVLVELKKIARNYPSLPLIAVDLCITENACTILEINAGCGTIAGQLDQGWLNHAFFTKYYPKRTGNSKVE